MCCSAISRGNGTLFVVGILSHSNSSCMHSPYGSEPLDDTVCDSSQIEAIVVHHLVPRSRKVTHELFLQVLLCVNLGDGSKLGVVAEDEVDGGAGPLELA